MRNIRGYAAAVVLCALGLWLATASALAEGKPLKIPATAPPDYPFMCGDTPVIAHAVVQNSLKIFDRRDGSTRLMFNGPSQTVLTGDGKMFTINSGGPGTLIFPRDGEFASSIVARGQTTYVSPTGAWLYTGRLVIDPLTGNIQSHTGSTTDLCLLYFSQPSR
jgi:hypothetical protein